MHGRNGILWNAERVYVGVNHLRNEELATLFYYGRIWRGGIHMSF